ncbi:amino acid adenylation domain-containing protein [Streptomyces sp. NPDC101181]|uniref:amino acid adenylation domain-containing protein n=1 Tax=Streptomyces sp. NPDC101181 TaxID=3366125 RepID=UPI00380CF962
MTLLDVLLGAVREAPGQVVVHIRGDGAEMTVTLRELLDDALRVAGGFREAGVAAGTCVPLLADRSEDFQPMFWGALAAGLVPVPLAPDARRTLPVWEHLGRPPVAVDGPSTPVADEFPDDVSVLTLHHLRGAKEPLDLATATATAAHGRDGVAFVQFSSGSTGAPKGVEVTHRAVLANLEQIREASALGAEDVVVSWMPYFHDMGLIGTHLAPLAARAKQVKIGPLSFAKRPRVWFEVADRHRATVLSAANFALALAVRRVPDDVVARLDLSAVRLMLVGAEPIAPAVWRDFVRKTRPAGLRPAAAQPVYGLAEATLAVTFPPPGEIAQPLVLDRAALSDGMAVDTQPGPGAVELMDVGAPVTGCVVRVVDDAGTVLGDRRVGHILVSGPQLARGYHELPGVSADTFADGWLRTGDLGFLRDGRLCVTGRHKDVLFLNGRTFHAPDLEEVVAATPGLPTGAPAVIGSTDPVSGRERVVVFVPWARPPGDAGVVLARVAARVREALFHDDVRVLPLAPGAFPRTTSGKLQRQRLRERFEAGAFEAGAWGTGAIGEASGSADARGPATPSAVREEEPRARPASPRTRAGTETVVREVWARVLGLPASAISSDERFGSLGGTSLKAMEVLVALEEAFGVTLPPAVIRDHGTVAELASHLATVAPGPRAATPVTPQTPAAPSPAAPEPAASSCVAQEPTASRSLGQGPEGDAPQRSSSPASVGVIGMACRFPGAGTPEAFWDLLIEGYDAVTPVPRGRWDTAVGRKGTDPQDPRGAGGQQGRWGAFLDDTAGFDAAYFGIGHEEARALDPQARLFLELAHEALERAGYAGPRRRGRRVGVFAAVGDSGYREVLDGASGGGTLPPSSLTGNLPNLVAARVSQCLDLDGPALAVDTACSSGLVALHLARRSLLDGECDLAVVGGVNLHLTSTGHRLLEEAGALSPTGRCRAFSADADGFVPGEGGAALVLTRLDAVRPADDPVLAVVRATAVNNDGRSLSLMAPNPLRQREVITRAYEEAGIDPAAVTYVEAHGTGTAVGDPIELRSLAHAFPARPDGEPRLLGSVKTNTGHLLNAAALPALVKVVLALGRRRLPASLHHTPPSPGLKSAGFAVVAEARDWTSAGPLVAGVNSFGFGGTNAHAVLEQAPPPSARRQQAPLPAAPGHDEAEPHLLTLSARSAAALREAAARLAEHLVQHSELSEGDICRTASTSRDDGPHRLAVVAQGDLRERLAAAGEISLGGGCVPPTGRRVVFLFPGQGTRFPGRGRALYRTAPVFRDTLDEASALLGPVRGRSLLDWALGSDAKAAGDASEGAARTEVAQPLLVATGVALARQVRSWGLEPDAVAGHSAGEIAAACASGALSLADAVRFAAERGRLMGEFTGPGAMLAVRGGEEQVASLVAGSDGALAVAAYNGPGLLVVAGGVPAVERAARDLGARGVAVRRLDVSRAFHSPLMRPVADRLAAAAGALTPQAPSVPLMSTLTAAWQPDLDPDHLRDHALSPVRFGAAVERLAEEGYDTFVELGQGGTLLGAVRAAAGRGGSGSGGRKVLVVMPVLPADSDADRPSASDRGKELSGSGEEPSGSGKELSGRRGRGALLETIGRLWAHGVPLDRTALDSGHHRVDLPTYPFQRSRHWPDPPATQLLHQVRWEDAPLPEGTAAVRPVLLTGPDSASVDLLAGRLAAEGIPVHGVAEGRPDTVILVAGPAPRQRDDAAPGRAQAVALAAFDTALAHLDATGAERLLVITEDVHTTGAVPERPRPVHALLTGLLLAVPQETPGASALGVDLCSLDSPAQRLAAVLAELRSPAAPGEAGNTAWRAGRRLTRTVTPLPATAREPEDAAPATGAPADPPRPGGSPTSGAPLSGASFSLPPDGTFLITGGGGGIGAALARDLASKGRPTLVLAGRSPAPPTGLADELRALGATVRYQVADMTLERDVEALVAGLPRLDAVFHAAGIVRPGTLRGRTSEEAAAALAAKTRGTRLLASALRRHDRRPAVCVAFSSVSALLPGLAGALGDYAGAKAFLDAFAASERAAGRPWLSVNLAAVAGTGMAAALDAGAGAALVSRPGGRPVAVAPALAALRTACAVDAAQVVLADLTPDAACPPAHSGHRADPEVPARWTVPASGATAGSVPDVPPRPLPVAGGGATGPGTAALLRGLLASALGLAPGEIPDDQPFLTLGLDSLAAVDLVRRLEQERGTPLPATLFFEYRTVRELAAHLDTLADPPPAPGAVAGGAPSAPRGEPADAPVPEGVPFALTPVQLALHTGHRLHPDVPAHGYVRQTVGGPLDPDLLGRALARLAERHSMLRIRIESATGGDGGTLPRQYVAPAAEVTEWYEVRNGLAAGDSLAAVETALCNRPFDLTREPPVRAVLVRESPALAHLLLVIHHAAGDGYSLNVLGEDLWSLYTSLALGEAPSLPAPGADFARYAAADAEERASAAGAAVLDADRRYWADRLAARGAAPRLSLPYDGDPGALPAPPLTTRQSALDAVTTGALEERAAAHGVSLFHLLLAAQVRCLTRWTGQREIAVNVARARRDIRLPGVDRLVGPLADTLPLLCATDPDESVWALAGRLGRIWLEGERHATPTALDLARLLPSDHPGDGPRTVSPAGFSFARFPAVVDGRCPVDVRPTAAGTGTPATRLSLLCWQDGAVLRFSWNFPVRLFDPATVARFDRDFHDQLTALAGPRAEPDAPARPNSGSGSGSGSGSTIVRRLLDQFRATPDAIAVHAGEGRGDGGSGTLTYAELDRASRAVADRLRAHGVTRGGLVGLLTEPGADTVVAVVAILRAGAGWVPLDAGHPTARLADQVSRTGVRTVLCHAPTRAAADALGDVAPVPVDVPADATAPRGAREREDVPATEQASPEGRSSGEQSPGEPVDAASTAYVIFTSGSTGRPKAVPISYRSMENYLDWAIGTFRYHAGDRLAQTASVCFDASVRQLLAPLLVGATVVTVPWQLLRDPGLLLTHVERTRITVWSSVPTLWEQLLTAAEERMRGGAPRPDLSALRWVHVGGEALSPAHVRRWFDLLGDGQRIANLYGPTEATVNTTCHIISSRPGDDVRRLPIGRPVAGAEVEIVGPDGRTLQPGEEGELFIAGMGLTSGYLGEPALTDAAFTIRRGRRWYRSGDRVRSTADGTLEFLGRLDDQVKVRGHRVEPGEIEAVLQTHEDVAHAVVLLQEGRLAAFVTPRPGASGVDAVALRRRLGRTLPPYMVPSRITSVDSMPLTGTGKVDRRRLLALGGPRTSAGASRTGAGSGDTPPRTPPLTATEIRLARIWSQLLGTDDVCREDDFFALGGDSLLVLEVFARLEKEGGGPLPRPTAVYHHRTLAALATAVDAATRTPSGTDPAAEARTPHAENGPFPLTPTQRGFLLAETIAPGASSSWLTRLRLHGPLDADRFQRAVDTLVARHAMLRTVFPAGARPAVQQELPSSLRLPVEFETPAEAHRLDEKIAAERARRFELWAWPLLRLRVFTLEPDEHVLVVHAHHIIGDGYSAALLVRELLAVYDAPGDGDSPAPPRTTFRDYAARLAGAEEAGREARRDEGSRWARLSAPYARPVLGCGTVTGPVGDVPGRTGADGVGPAFHAGGFVLDAARVEALRALAARAGATLYAPVLTAYYRALVASTGTADVVLGLAVSGRDHAALPDVHRVFGPCATAVPLRPAGGAGCGRPADAGFEDDLRRVAAEAAAARTHEGPVPALPDGLPLTSQFFFTYLDFSALGPESGQTLRIVREDGDSTYTPPPFGTDVFLSARLDDGRLRITLRAAATALTPQGLAAFAATVRESLTEAADTAAPTRDRAPHRSRDRLRSALPGAGSHGAAERGLDAALMGYLPSPGHLARLAGLPEERLAREELRVLLFPDGGPRLLETLSTPLGRSGFVCLPVFADELAPGDSLLGHTVGGVTLASSLGARSVSLAGMIPSLTGYGFDVLRATRDTGVSGVAVTTGHAATVVSVVKSVHAALDAGRRDLSELTVAFVGLGSIGSSSLELLLGRAERPPARLLLCDAPGSGPRLTELAASLRGRGLAGAVEVLTTDGGLPREVYGARLIVAAVSGGGSLLDVDRLAPGTTVVDDSFPHCFDTRRAIGRMERDRDVLVAGGGLLSVGATERRVAEGLPAAAVDGYSAQPWLPGAVASCRLESLLHASGAGVPLVHGTVDSTTAQAYWDAAEAAGAHAAPPHLLTHTIDVAALGPWANNKEVAPPGGSR